MMWEYYDDRHTTKIDLWYDPHIRLWTLTPMDDENIQTAPCDYAYGKTYALERKADMEREYGIGGKK